ncbi:hypothetical protein [Acetomicrobium sp.]|nr:hypothetical protein [Acetomicrobium sp.]MDR9769522.1 hypothetical protein [Acetomicrobium sp.]
MDVFRLRRGTLKLRVPNPHVGDISIPLLKEILRQVGIFEDEWNNTK